MKTAMRLAIGTVAVVTTLYVASPYWAGWQLRQAMKARDTASLQSRVDWPVLRQNLKPKLSAAVDASAKEAGGVTGYLKRVIGSAVADKGVDLFVTPANLARVLAGREFVTSRLGRPGAASVPPPPSSGKGAPPSNDPADVEDPDDPVPPRRVRYAFFETPTRFRVEAVHPRLPGQRLVTHFDLSARGWKLVDVDVVAQR